MATMKDVAKLAGVSVGTVSRVVNGSPGIKPLTLKKVKAAIKQLNYVPDEYARGMKKNKSNTVALILPSVWNPFFSEFAYHVENKLASLGYKMIICDSQALPDKELGYIKMVQQNKIDGIIGVSYSDIGNYVSSDLPFVSLDRSYDETVTYVTSDNYQGGKIAAKKLLECGVEHPAFVGSYNHYKNDTMLRSKGFCDELEKRQITYDILYELEPIEEFNQKIETFIKSYPKIDGIFCQTDFVAMNTIKILEKLGKKVPLDVQVIGYDGIKMTWDWPYFVSTIAQPITKLAESAVDLLLEKINDPTAATTILKLPVTYKFGGTTLK